MKINEAMRKFRLPNPASQEDLEGRWSSVLVFGDRVLMAGYYYNGDAPSYFAAVYEFLTHDTTCEGPIGLMSVSDLEFEDNGHAIAWAIEEAKK